MSETITISRADLMAFAAETARQVAVSLQHRQGLPEYYAFPEDIFTILKGKVPLNTIRYWKQQGYIRTFKLGKYCFVRPDDWDYFTENYQHLIAGGNSA